MRNKLYTASIWYIAMALFFSTNASADKKNYHYLADNKTQSENYEIIKLINGPVDAVFHHNPTQATIIFTGIYAWKIDRHGRLIDTFSIRATQWYSSGVIQHNDRRDRGAGDFVTFNDWMFTGEKGHHAIKISPVPNGLSEDQLASRLDQAEVVEFLTTYIEEDDINKNQDKGGRLSLSRDRNVVLIKEGATWTALDIEGYFGELEHSSMGYDRLWDITNVEGYTKKHIGDMSQLLKMESSGVWSLDAKSKPLTLNRFSRRLLRCDDALIGYLIMLTPMGRAAMYAPNFPESYWYWDGVGFFELEHGSEILRFKAPISNRENKFSLRSHRIYSPSSKSDIKIIEVNEGDARDQGVFIVRKKFLKNTRDVTKTWQLRLSGEFVGAPIWGDVVLSGSNESHHYMQSAAFSNNGYQAFPKSLSVHWRHPDIRSFYKLRLNQNESIWLDFRKYREEVDFELEFDEAEIKKAFSKFGVIDGSITLVLDVKKETQESGELSVTLKGRMRKVELTKTTFKYKQPGVRNSSDKNDSQGVLEKLEVDYGLAISNKMRIDDFLMSAQTILEGSPLVDQHVEEGILLSSRLFQHYFVSGDHEMANILIKHFLNKQLPTLKDTKYSTDYSMSVFASQGLALSVVTNNQELGARIFDEMIGLDFDVSDQINATLMYNLACYHAVHDRKNFMLAAIRQSIALGKPPSKFMADRDFKSYKKDADFVKALNSKITLSPEVEARAKELVLTNGF